jgi:hypothetical protein
MLFNFPTFSLKQGLKMKPSTTGTDLAVSRGPKNRANELQPG